MKDLVQNIEVALMKLLMLRLLIHLLHDQKRKKQRKSEATIGIFYYRLSFYYWPKTLSSHCLNLSM